MTNTKAIEQAILTAVQAGTLHFETTGYTRGQMVQRMIADFRYGAHNYEICVTLNMSEVDHVRGIEYHRRNQDAWTGIDIEPSEWTNIVGRQG